MTSFCVTWFRNSRIPNLFATIRFSIIRHILQMVIFVFVSGNEDKVLPILFLLLTRVRSKKYYICFLQKKCSCNITQYGSGLTKMLRFGQGEEFAVNNRFAAPPPSPWCYCTWICNSEQKVWNKCANDSVPEVPFALFSLQPPIKD